MYTSFQSAGIACDELNARMQVVGATLQPGYTWAKLVEACYVAGMDLTTRHT